MAIKRNSWWMRVSCIHWFHANKCPCKMPYKLYWYYLIISTSYPPHHQQINVSQTKDFLVLYTYYRDYFDDQIFVNPLPKVLIHWSKSFVSSNVFLGDLFSNLQKMNTFEVCNCPIWKKNQIKFQKHMPILH